MPKGQSTVSLHGVAGRTLPVKQIYPTQRHTEESLIVDNLVKSIARMLLDTWSRESGGGRS